MQTCSRQARLVCLRKLPGPESADVRQAQVPKPVPARIAALKHRDKCTLPVVFFGTNEILWAEPKDHKTWAEGVREGLHAKAKGTKGLKLAILEVELPFCLCACECPGCMQAWDGVLSCCPASQGSRHGLHQGQAG